MDQLKKNGKLDVSSGSAHEQPQWLRHAIGWLVNRATVTHASGVGSHGRGQPHEQVALTTALHRIKMESMQQTTMREQFTTAAAASAYKPVWSTFRKPGKVVLCE